MNFWDSSALVPLCVEETKTSALSEWVRSDPEMAAWAWSDLEIMSALCRRRREGNLSEESFVLARKRRDILFRSMTLIKVHDDVRSVAERMLCVHPLRCADALQLAAAWVAFGKISAQVSFITLDNRLASAARKEGFEVPAFTTSSHA